MIGKNALGGSALASVDLLVIPYNELSEVSRKNSGQLFQHKNINVADT